MTPTPRSRRPLRLLAVAALVAAPVAACGDDDDEGASTTTEAAATSEAEGAAIALEGAWARTSPAMATAGAVYVQIVNDGDADDALIGVAVDASVAAKAELHETTAADDSMDDGMDDDAMGEDEMGDDGMGEGSGTTMGDDMGGGMMQMVPVDEIPVPAGETVALEPGGYHIMLLELAAPLEVGTTIEVTLTFEESGELVLEAEVRDMAP